MGTEPTVWEAFKAKIKPAYIIAAVVLLLIGTTVYVTQMNPEYWSAPLRPATMYNPLTADIEYVYPFYLTGEAPGGPEYIGSETYQWAQENLLDGYEMVGYTQYRGVWICEILGQPKEPVADGSTHVLYALAYAYNPDTARWEFQGPWVATTLNEYVAAKEAAGVP